MVRTANPALLKPMQLSPELEAVTGKGPMSRGEVVKKLWEYIKKNNLQNPANKRNILADDKLKTLFGGKGEVTMFEMTKLVSPHLK
ncbi:SWIB/MDM2 domain-containing protein [Candidatus Kaiserbacteria bacterium]|nr:SWIB/MDM2 domain-containing protein [Candidatus Kaiserbacteria bacterium]